MNPLQRSLSHVTAREESKERLRESLSARQGGRFRPLASALACLLLMLGVGFWQLWRTPVSYISIDINPSIELALNRLDRVVAVTAYNEDGAAVAQGLSLENRPYQQAMAGRRGPSELSWGGRKALCDGGIRAGGPAAAGYSGMLRISGPSRTILSGRPGLSGRSP